jgi:hypothetical protein
MAHLKDRMTVVEKVYYQQVGDSPTSFEFSFSRDLTSHEQVYRRQCKAERDWEPLDYGWIKEVGTILIQNEEGKRLFVNPTEEEKADTASRIIEVSCICGLEIPSGWLVYPGETFRGSTECLGRVRIRCREGTAVFTVIVIPS